MTPPDRTDPFPPDPPELEAAGAADLDSLLNGTDCSPANTGTDHGTSADTAIGAAAPEKTVAQLPSPDLSDSLLDLIASAPDSNDDLPRPDSMDDSDVVVLQPAPRDRSLHDLSSTEPATSPASVPLTNPLPASDATETEENVVAPQIAAQPSSGEASSTPDADSNVVTQLHSQIQRARSRTEAWLLKHQDPLPRQDPRAVTRLTEQLNSLATTDKSAVCDTLQQLAATNSPAAVASLRTTSSRPQADVRQCSAECLGQIPHTSSVLGLLSMLDDTSPRVVDAAVTALTRQHQPRCLSVLLLLGCLHPRLRAVVQDGLLALDDEKRQQWISPLRRLTGSGNHRLAAAAVTLLGRLATSEHLGLFSHLVEHTEAGIRVAAVDVLARSGSRRCVSLINAAIQDPVAAVRAAAATGLRHLHSPNSVALLTSALDDTDPSVRFAAARTLSRLDESGDTTQIARHLEHTTDPQVRELLTETLARHQAPEVLPVLRTLLTSAPSELRQQGLQLIRRYTVPGLDSEIASLVSDPDPDIRRQAIDCLSPRSVAQAAEAIANCLAEDSSESVRAAAARALGNSRTPRIVRQLEEALYDAVGVRSQAILSLGKTGSADCVPALLAQLKDESADIRRLACTAIGRIGKLTNTEPLEQMLDDPDSGVRRNAGAALEQLGVTPPSALRRRWKRFFGRRPSVRRSSTSRVLPLRKLATGTLTLGLIVALGYGVTAWVGRASTTVSGPVSTVLATSLSEDGAVLAILRRRGVVDLWNLETGTLTSRIKADSQTKQVAFRNRDSLMLFGRGRQSTWNITADPYGSSLTGQTEEQLGAPVRRIPLDSSSCCLVGGKSAVLFDLGSQQILHRADFGVTLPDCLSVSPDQKLIVFGADDGGLTFAAADSGQLLYQLSGRELFGDAGKPPTPRRIAFSPDSRQMAITYNTGQVQLWDMAAMRLIHRIVLRPPPEQIVFNPADSSVVAAAREQVTVLSNGLREQTSIELEQLATPAHLCVSRDGRRLVVVAEDSRDALIVDLASAQLKHQLKPQ